MSRKGLEKRTFGWALYGISEFCRCCVQFPNALARSACSTDAAAVLQYRTDMQKLRIRQDHHRYHACSSEPLRRVPDPNCAATYQFNCDQMPDCNGLHPSVSYLQYPCDLLTCVLV